MYPLLITLFVHQPQIKGKTLTSTVRHQAVLQTIDETARRAYTIQLKGQPKPGTITDLGRFLDRDDSLESDLSGDDHAPNFWEKGSSATTTPPWDGGDPLTVSELSGEDIPPVGAMKSRNGRPTFYTIHHSDLITIAILKVI